MIHRFDEFELDTERFELLRSGRPVRIEPKVFELIAFLAERAGELVTKDEMVERVWQGRFVSDSALARAIHEARKALGENASAPRFLHTVHGRGYRFSRAEPVDGSGGEPEVGTVKEAGAAAGRRQQALAAVLLGVLAGGLWLGVRTAVRTPQAEPAQPATMAILPLSVHEETPEAELAALSLLDLLRLRLSQVEGLSVRPIDPVGRSLEIGSLDEYAEEVGARYVLTGSLSPREGTRLLALSFRIFDFGGPGGVREMPLGSYSIRRLEEGSELPSFLATREAVVERALELLGPTFALRGASPAPRDGEAYRLYLLAYQQLLDSFCAGGAAEELARRSLEIDPEFAPAWDLLATAYYNQVWACGADASLYELAMEANDRAIELDPELAIPRFRRISLLIETGEVERAYELILAEAERDPDGALTLNASAYALRVAGFLDEAAAALDRLLEVDPLIYDVGAMGGSPNTLIYRGELDRFLAVLPASGMPYMRYYRGFVKVLQGDAAAARAELEPAFRAGPGEVFGRLAHALLAILEDDPAAARRIVRELASQRERLGARDGEITYKQAELLALAGDADGALGELRSAVEQGFFCVPCLETDPSFDELREHESWSEVFVAARSRHHRFAVRFGLTPSVRPGARVVDDPSAKPPQRAGAG